MNTGIHNSRIIINKRIMDIYRNIHVNELRVYGFP